ncbi:MAG: hypothetical protein D8H99_38305 [Streptococcus sp.]|nr:MAG: hypothetical protein D8H99_38305 [Streptococcus sp.]
MIQSISTLLKNIAIVYRHMSPLLALPVWIGVGLSIMFVFNDIKLLLPIFVVLGLTWLFVAVYFETYSSDSERSNQIKDYCFTVYNTIGLLIITYFIVFYN